MPTNVTTEPTKITTRELAKRWRLSERAIFDLRVKHGLPFVRLGAVIRFDTVAVELWAAARTTGGTR